MNRIDRLLGVVTFLQSHRFVTAERLAAKFETSVRTVYRDIKALNEIGIPVAFENHKGYFIMQGYFLPPISFTSEEANALLVMTSLADRFGDRSIAKHSDNALQKIRAVLLQSDKEKSENLKDRIKVLNPNPGENNFLSIVQNSIAEKKILHAEYIDAKKQRTKREIEPIGIIYYTEQWHVIAWCWKRHDYRDFRLSQIQDLKLTLKTFQKSDHITLDQHIQSWYN